MPVRGALSLSLLLLVLSALPCNGLYVRVRQGGSKCFIEMLEKHTVVVINYKSPDQAPLPQEPEALAHHVGVSIQVVNYAGRVYENKLDTQGRMSFTTPFNGEHRVCFSVGGNSLGQDFRVNIAIQQGLEQEDHDDLVQHGHLSAMDLRVRDLSTQIDKIKDDQSHFRERETRFFVTTESTHMRSQWCSVLQILVMVVVTGANIAYLQYYFTSKKVV